MQNKKLFTTIVSSDKSFLFNIIPYTFWKFLELIHRNHLLLHIEWENVNACVNFSLSGFPSNLQNHKWEICFYSYKVFTWIKQGHFQNHLFWMLFQRNFTLQRKAAKFFVPFLKTLIDSRWHIYHAFMFKCILLFRAFSIL